MPNAGYGVHTSVSSTGCRGKTACPQPQLKFDSFLSYFARVSDIENVARILDAEGLDIGAIAKYGLISMGYSLDDTLFEKRKTLCLACWFSEIEPQIDSRFDIATVVLAGVQFLARLKGPASWCFQASNSSVPGMLQLNTHASAFLEIARHIGLTFEQIADDDAVSPFTLTRPDVPW